MWVGGSYSVGGYVPYPSSVVPSPRADRTGPDREGEERGTDSGYEPSGVRSARRPLPGIGVL